MAELKTKQTKASVEKFLKGIKDEKKREDSFKILKLMGQITKAEPKMWGPNIIGFGNYHYKYKSGREGDWFLTGFSPRKQSLTLYLMTYLDKHKDLLKKLGKHKTGKGCLYINKLEDVEIKVLKELITTSVKKLK
jgi:nucleoid DNA-binding protein